MVWWNLFVVVMQFIGNIYRGIFFCRSGWLLCFVSQTFTTVFPVPVSGEGCDCPHLAGRSAEAELGWGRGFSCRAVFPAPLGPLPFQAIGCSGCSTVSLCIYYIFIPAFLQGTHNEVCSLTTSLCDREGWPKFTQRGMWLCEDLNPGLLHLNQLYHYATSWCTICLPP